MGKYDESLETRLIFAWFRLVCRVRGHKWGKRLKGSLCRRCYEWTDETGDK